MEYYTTLVTLHIIFAGGWLLSFITDSILKRLIKAKKDNTETRILINIYLKTTGLLGLISANGILLTGILMVVINPGYNFFDMSANHWLATKQILMIVLLIVIFVFVIPTAKQIRNQMELQVQLSDDFYKYLNKIFKLNLIVNIIVLLNFLFAITHRYIG